MKRTRIALGIGFSLALCLAWAGCQAGAQQSQPAGAERLTVPTEQTYEVDIRELISETQITSDDMTINDLVWWVPVDFWRITMSNDPSVTETLIAQFEETLAPYLMFVIIHGKIGPFGGITWTPEAEIRSTMQIVDSKGRVHSPFQPAEIGPDAKIVADSLKPVLSNMMGPMGENTHVVFFPSKAPDGTTVADPRGSGTFSMRMLEHSYSWRLPLGSLLPQKRCPVDEEMLNGAWEYCPWHGKKLLSGTAK